MDDRIERVGELLHQASETHHLVYRIVDGDDPDWASWYANWLRDLCELSQILGVAPVLSELVWLLVTLDQDYTKAGPSTPWPQWYAERMLEHSHRSRASKRSPQPSQIRTLSEHAAGLGPAGRQGDDQPRRGS